MSNREKIIAMLDSVPVWKDGEIDIAPEYLYEQALRSIKT